MVYCPQKTALIAQNKTRGTVKSSRFRARLVGGIISLPPLLQLDLLRQNLLVHLLQEPDALGHIAAHRRLL